MILPHTWHGSGEPLVLIAGLGAKGTSWQPFLEQAANRFRVLTFDNRGSGRAPALPARFTVRDMARDVLRLLDHAGVARARVVGRSMGGMIAQELALLAPERVERLVLVGTTGRVDPHLRQLFRLWAEMAEQGVDRDIRHKSSLLWCLGAHCLGTPEAAAYLEAKGRSDRPADYARQARACSRHDALARLRGLDAPTLVVVGSDDRMTPPSQAETLAKTIPGASLSIVPGAGHLAYLEAPEVFATEVLGFLENGEPAQGGSPCPIASTKS